VDKRETEGEAEDERQRERGGGVSRKAGVRVLGARTKRNKSGACRGRGEGVGKGHAPLLRCKHGTLPDIRAQLLDHALTRQQTPTRSPDTHEEPVCTAEF